MVLFLNLQASQVWGGLDNNNNNNNKGEAVLHIRIITKHF